MKKNRLPALALALTLLGGCAVTPAEESGNIVQGDNGVQSDDLAYQCAGLTRDFPLLTVNGETVEAGDYLFWLANTIRLQESYYGLPETAEEWAEVSDDLKADALDTTLLYEIVERKAKELGLALSEETVAQIEQEQAEFVEELGGQEAYVAYLDNLCATEEELYHMNEVYYLNQLLLETLTADGTLTVTQEDIDGVVNEMVEQNGYYAAKHILIATRQMNEDGTAYEDYSEEEKQAAYEKALNLRENLLEEQDSEAVFDELMHQFSEDSRDPETGELYAPNGYGLVPLNYMVPEFEEATLALEIGQVSDIVTSDYGYHIIMRIPVDTTDLESYVTENYTETYKLSLLIQDWMDEATVVSDPAYDTISVYDFYTKLTAANEVLHPAESESEN